MKHSKKLMGSLLTILVGATLYILDTVILKTPLVTLISGLFLVGGLVGLILAIPRIPK